MLTVAAVLYLVEAQEVLDGGRRVEDVTFSRHHQHEAVQRLQAERKHGCFLSQSPLSCSSEAKPNLQQQVSLREADSVDGGGHRGEGGGERRRRGAMDVPSKQPLPLAAPAGAVRAGFHDGCRGKIQTSLMLNSAQVMEQREELLSVCMFLSGRSSLILPASLPLPPLITQTERLNNSGENNGLKYPQRGSRRAGRRKAAQMDDG